MGFEELTYINGDNCLEDCARIFDNITLGSKPYVVFRNELRRDMERNINMFPISPERQQEINQFFSDREEHYQKVKSQTR